VREWLQTERQKCIKRLQAIRVESLRLEGGIAALEEAIRAESGQGGANPGPAYSGDTQDGLGGLTKRTPVQGVSQAVRCSHGAIQADEEFHE